MKEKTETKTIEQSRVRKSSRKERGGRVYSGKDFRKRYKKLNNVRRKHAVEKTIGPLLLFNELLCSFFDNLLQVVCVFLHHAHYVVHYVDPTQLFAVVIIIIIIIKCLFVVIFST